MTSTPGIRASLLRSLGNRPEVTAVTVSVLPSLRRVRRNLRTNRRRCLRSKAARIRPGRHGIAAARVGSVACEFPGRSGGVGRNPGSGWSGAGRRGPVPGLGPGQVTDGVAGPAEVVAAALTIAFRGLPAEGERLEPFAAEKDRGHPDMPRVIPVVPALLHLVRRRPPARRIPAGWRMPSASLATHRGPRTTSSSSSMTNGVVASRLPAFLRRAIVSKRLRSPGPSGARDPDDAQCHPLLGLDRLPDVLAWWRQVAAQEEQVDIHGSTPRAVMIASAMLLWDFEDRDKFGTSEAPGRARDSRPPPPR